nr:basic proline-rich protein-like [Manis javanica]
MVPEPQTQTASGSPRAASGAAVESHTRRAPPSPWCIRAHTRSRVSRAGPEPVAALQGARARHPGCPGAPAPPTRPPRGRSPRPGPAGGPLPRPTLARRPPARSPSALAHLAAAGVLGPRAGRPLRQEAPLAASAPGAPPGGSARLVPPGAELGGGKAGAWARRVRGAVSPPRSRGASRPRFLPSRGDYWFRLKAPPRVQEPHFRGTCPRLSGLRDAPDGPAPGPPAGPPSASPVGALRSAWSSAAPGPPFHKSSAESVPLTAGSFCFTPCNRRAFGLLSARPPPSPGPRGACCGSGPDPPPVAPRRAALSAGHADPQRGSPPTAPPGPHSSR